MSDPISDASSEGGASTSSHTTISSILSETDKNLKESGGADGPAPLSEFFADPSIDGSSVAGSENGIGRPGKAEEVTDEQRKEALEIKTRGNALFKESNFRQALDQYTLSLNVNPFDPAVWANRAAARLKLEEHGLVIYDATRAIELDPKYAKAYLRRAMANLASLKYKVALQDLKEVVKLDPKNENARQQYQSTHKIIRQKAFESAIAIEDKVPTSTRLREMLDSGSEPIDPSYAGPRLKLVQVGGDGKGKGKEKAEITEEFIKEMVEWFKKGKILPKRIAWEIVLAANEILSKEASLTEVEVGEGEKINVIGDTHGQFFDFLHLLRLTGPPSETNLLLFNGDFVDRGSWSTEVALTLFAYKWLHPKKLILNRGNHETSDMNKVYGFEGETKKKYSEMTYELFEETFIALPLASLITSSKPPAKSAKQDPRLPRDPVVSPNGVKRFFVCHGGLFSDDSTSLDDVRSIPRMKLRQPGQQGVMCELLWTDPQVMNGRGPSKRGVGLGFGPDVTKRWCEKEGVTALIRSHEVRQEGYSIEHDGLCITVFSAPNYVDQVGNSAAFIVIDETGTMQFETFEAQPHPDIKPMAYAGSFGLSGMF